MIYASLYLRATLVHVPSHCIKPQGFECTMVKFSDLDSSGLAYIICLYIPPGLKADTFQSIKQFITDCLDAFLIDNPEAVLYLCGDFNRYDVSFLSDQFNLTNVVDTPTFGNNVLDNFFVQKP